MAPNTDELYVLVLIDDGTYMLAPNAEGFALLAPNADTPPNGYKLGYIGIALPLTL